MNPSTSDLAALARLSFVDPVAGGKAVIALNPPMAARWALLAASIVVAVVLAYALPLLLGQGDALPAPFVATGVQGAMNLLAVVMIALVGRQLGGRGRIEDALLLVGWLQALMLVLQLGQLVTLLVLPVAAVGLTMASIGVFLWLLTGFICALHGFTSRFLALLGVVLGALGAAVILSFVLLLFGFELPGVTDV